MCRLLALRAKEPKSMRPLLSDFAAACRESKEYQGHGWGISYRQEGQWRHYKNIKPIWEDDFDRFGDADFFLAHARSAFRDEGIVIDNNMPFSDQGHIFMFNGELQGVRLNVEGRIGAEKIFNLIKRFHRGDLSQALARATQVITKRTRYIRAMNIVLTDLERIYVASHFSEDPDYFTLHRKNSGDELICSQPLGSGWKPIPNQSQTVL